MRELGLDISLVGSHGFKTGMCNPQQQQQCLKILRERIDLAADQGYRRVITFTGMLPEGMPRGEAFDHCVAGFKQIVGHAEKRKITLCLEHLNSRDDTHPMKGHPGYYGDDVDEVVQIPHSRSHAGGVFNFGCAEQRRQIVHLTRRMVGFTSATGNNSSMPRKRPCKERFRVS